MLTMEQEAKRTKRCRKDGERWKEMFCCGESEELKEEEEDKKRRFSSFESMEKFIKCPNGKWQTNKMTFNYSLLRK